MRETWMNTELHTPALSGLFDHAEALARVEGDQELLGDLAEIFLREAPEILQRLHEAVERGDAKAVAAEAHSMKGSVSNFGSRIAVSAALALETIGRGEDLRDAPEALSQLAYILNLLAPLLEHLPQPAGLPTR